MSVEKKLEGMVSPFPLHAWKKWGRSGVSTLYEVSRGGLEWDFGHFALRK